MECHICLKEEVRSNSQTNLLPLQAITCSYYASIHKIRMKRHSSSPFDRDVVLSALCLSYHSNTEAVLFACLSSFRQAGPPQPVDCLDPRWKTPLRVFPKDRVTRYRSESRTNVSQPFDY